ncbi:glycoside hydrolase family 3 N-terminal domain-containing protein [Amnibacterium endophyticum]|uniref:beta-glucosidase n=1 Tax=Amnibacterium endophyticum TaxID=2109337 RepID=A0ABW4LHX0_9MICO
MADRTPIERVEDLLAQLTLEEKAGQLTQYFYFNRSDQESPASNAAADQPAEVEAALGASGVGSLLFQTDPGEINRLQRLAVEGNRLGIPALFGFDVIHGLRTVLPVPIAMAATWDPAAIEAGQAVAAREARAVGIHWAFAPNVDIARDPRWGRIVEGAGEDPYLGAAVAAAQVRGFQGEAIGQQDRIIAGPKHFAGYGASLGGRDYDEVDLSDQQLWNVYLEPFRAAVEAGAGNIMTAYMPLNGVPATGNRWLLEHVLRGAWGFDGFTVSDANAVLSLATHHFAADEEDAAARALAAGLDMEMAITGPAYARLADAVRAGRVSEAALDDAVRRVLTAKAAMGLLDGEPYVDEERAQQVLTDPQHRETARDAARRSAVLLKNDDALLPLAPDRSIAVIGALADSKRDTLGPWIFAYDLDETVTVLDGLRKAASDVSFAPGYGTVPRAFPSIFDMFPNNVPADPEGWDADAEFQRAVDAAAAADVAVMVVGEWQNQVGENASRSTLELPGRQLELLQAVAATGTPVVLLVTSGRPLDLRWAVEHVPAIVQIWYPGTRGGEAVADLLLGAAAPTGRLPFSWPRHVGQVPMIYSHTRSFEPQNQGKRYWDEESTPLLPFGHGLTYTSFAYSDVAVSSASVGREDVVTVTATITNTGDRDGVEVAQLYLHQRHGAAARPLKLLKGFQRLEVPAGGSAPVRFEIGPDERRYWSAAEQGWVLEASGFDVWVGADATAEAHAEFAVE